MKQSRGSLSTFSQRSNKRDELTRRPAHGLCTHLHNGMPSFSLYVDLWQTNASSVVGAWSSELIIQIPFHRRSPITTGGYRGRGGGGLALEKLPSLLHVSKQCSHNGWHSTNTWTSFFWMNWPIDHATLLLKFALWEIIGTYGTILCVP